jgi:putative membrane protein
MVKDNAHFRLAPWASVLVPIASYAQNAPQTLDWDCYGPWHMMHGSGWGFWWIFPILMMVLMVVACVFMVRFVMGHGHSLRDDTSSAVRLLNERFARGEIPKEEYEEKRAILSQSR